DSKDNDCDGASDEGCVSPCGDNICGQDETAEECPWDCRVSVQDKWVKIQYPTYTTRMVVHYKSDGTKDEIRDPNQVRSFLADKLDLSIEGSVRTIKGTIVDLSDDIVLLRYKQLNSLIPTDDPLLYQMVGDDEDAFVHAKGFPATKENRLITRSYFGQYLMNPGSKWREYYSAYVGGTYLKDPRVDGIFMDNALGRLLISGRYVRLVNESREVGDDGRTITIDGGYQLHTPEKWYPTENNIRVYDNPGGKGTNYFTGGTYDKTIITLGTPVAPRQRVYLSYYVMDAPDDDVITNWPTNTYNSIKYVKESLGDKLLVYNGIIESWTEDDGFPEITDGGMSEQFIYAPWSSLTAKPTESNWKKIVDELKTISKNRIYLAQSGVDFSDSDASKEQEMKRVAMFTFTSFLLGKDRYAYYHFGYRPYTYQNFTYFDYWETGIGKPLEDYRLRGKIGTANIYQREFENSLVLVNPSDADAVMSLDRTYKTLEGATVSEVELESRSGIILMKT
ncbi:MAG: hypothetical protein JXB14_05465, partial [Candidatus Altiarchaeota archaeon]|nr:hypothetical protein [Candidatus Altiarchaeota archaeon]